MKLRVIVDGKGYDVEVEEAVEEVEGSAATLPALQSAVLPTAKLSASSDVDETKVCRSPLAGVVARVCVSQGQKVEAGELLLVLEAMKMEIKIPAEASHSIKSVEAAPGDAVRANQVLLCFD